jgi:hypothetical protein
LKNTKERPIEVKKIIKSLIRANRYIREDKKGAVEVLVEWGRVDRDNASASYDSTVKVFNSNGNIPEDGLRLSLDLAKADLKITRTVAPAEVADLALLREVHREMGIKLPDALSR